MPIADKIEAITVQQGMRELGMLLLNANPETREQISTQILQILQIGANTIDRLERELAYERAINEQLRGIQPDPRPFNWSTLLMAGALACIALYYGITMIHPIVSYLM